MLFGATQAQRVCGSAAYAQTQTTTDNHSGFAGRPTGTQRDTSANETINIPVVIHILYNTPAQNITNAQVLSQLAVLNADFNNENADRSNTPEAFKPLVGNSRIRFCLAQVDPNNKATTGIIRRQTGITTFSADDAMKSSLRGGDDAWDSKKYLNIWVCPLGSRSLGYATAPGAAADKDGVVIAYDVFGTVGTLRRPFDKGRTATHEIGHWMGLKHIWGDNDCGDDGIDDTPQQSSYNFGCPTFPQLSSCSPNANGDMFMNFMDFSDDACMNMFTIGQQQKMRSLFATGNARNSFLTSFACDSTLIQAGPIGGNTDTPQVAAKADVYKVFPNPAGATLNVTYTPGAEMVNKTVRVFSAVGVNVITTQLTKANTSINVSQLAPGIYVVIIGEGSNKFITKIVKQ